MKICHYLIILLLLLLSSCSALKIKEPTLNDNTYTDSDFPRLKIKFPFSVKYVGQDFDFNDVYSSVSRNLYSEDNKITILLIKDKIFHGSYGFTGTDSSQFNENIYFDEDKNNFCTVDFYEENLISYLRGISFRYSGFSEIVKIITYKQLGYVSSVDEFKKKNKESVDKFIHDMKIICAQNVTVND